MEILEAVPPDGMETRRLLTVCNRSLLFALAACQQHQDKPKAARSTAGKFEQAVTWEWPTPSDTTAKERLRFKFCSFQAMHTLDESPAALSDQLSKAGL